MPDISEIFDFKSLSQLALIVILVVGGFSYLYFNPSQQSQFQSNTLDRLRVVEAKYDALLKENEVLRNQISSLKIQFVNARSTHDSYPWPSWIKDTQGTVIYANQAYVDWYLTPRGYNLFDYVGHTDYQVWPKELADQFKAHDHEVLKSGKAAIFEESVIGPDGKIENYEFIKYVRKVNNSIIGVAGMLLPTRENIN